MGLLDEVRAQMEGPVWINADILPGPGGTATPLEARVFLQAVAMRGQRDVLSLGWTTGWSPNTDNPGKTHLFLAHRLQYASPCCASCWMKSSFQY